MIKMVTTMINPIYVNPSIRNIINPIIEYDN